VGSTLDASDLLVRQGTLIDANLVAALKGWSVLTRAMAAPPCARGSNRPVSPSISDVL